MSYFCLRLPRLFFTLFIFLITLASRADAQTNRVFDEDYFAQKLPELSAEVFLPGIVSTALDEFNASFTSDGNEFYFSVRQSWNLMVICKINKTETAWSAPQILPLSGQYMDADPFVSHNGKTLFFCSDRPKPGTESKDWNIWAADKNGGSWGEPYLLPFNTDKNEMYVSQALNGNIYFHADYESGTGTQNTDIYCSKYIDGKYLSAEKVGGGVSSDTPEYDPFIAPDESYIVFSSPKAGGYGSGDLYISFRNDDLSWGEAVNMGSEINSRFMEYCAAISPDGKFFFFTSYRAFSPKEKITSYDELKSELNKPQRGGGDVYWISSEIITSLKK